MSSFPATSTLFAELIDIFPTWTELKSYLTSTPGGSLSVYDIPDSELATIRYVKGVSNFGLDHTKAFRSVVWNRVSNRPVSCTAFKSEMGEGFPADLAGSDDVVIEEFVDGVMIGQFWDESTESWRIHTRSTLDAECRYFSQTKTFAAMFQEAVARKFAGLAEPVADHLEKGVSYTWILQHPENRVVCPVVFPSLTLVQATRILPNGTLEIIADLPQLLADLRPRQFFSQSKNMPVGRLDVSSFMDFLCPIPPATAESVPVPPSIAAVAGSHIPVDLAAVAGLIRSMTGSIRHQGVVIKVASQPFLRWKMRSATYNTVRLLRGNSARRDFLWMDLWSKRNLDAYLAHFGEERGAALDLIARWKNITSATYKTYVDVFKARTLDKQSIPAKLRPLVYGLHSYYMNNLRPTGRSLDWRGAVQWMNERDTAQKIYVLNWDLRQEKSQRLPIEPSATSMIPTASVAATEA